MRLAAVALSVAIATAARPAGAQADRPVGGVAETAGLRMPNQPGGSGRGAAGFPGSAVRRTLLADRPTGFRPGSETRETGERRAITPLTRGFLELESAAARDISPGGVSAIGGGSASAGSTGAGSEPAPAHRHAGRVGDGFVNQAVAPREAWWSPLLSALVPGTGQALMSQDRAIAYFAVEGYGWIRYTSDLREALRQRNEYRGLAVRVARAYFSDVKPVGDFEYYERMEHYVESGVFDASVAEGTQPETDPESYNGFIWLRARTTYWEDPAIPPPAGSDAFISAIRYYESRAIKPEFRWSWRNAQLEQDLFRRMIGRSNDAFRRSIQDLGVIIANHVLSTVDAYVTVRIRHARDDPGNVGVEASIPW